jgi:hypothetical protein
LTLTCGIVVREESLTKPLPSTCLINVLSPFVPFFPHLSLYSSFDLPNFPLGERPFPHTHRSKHLHWTWSLGRSRERRRAPRAHHIFTEQSLDGPHEGYFTRGQTSLESQNSTALVSWLFYARVRAKLEARHEPPLDLFYMQTKERSEPCCRVPAQFIPFINRHISSLQLFKCMPHYSSTSFFLPQKGNRLPMHRIRFFLGRPLGVSSPPPGQPT